MQRTFQTKPGTIAVEKMHFRAFHGYYDEEQTAGNDYSVDVYIRTDLIKASQQDRLPDTLNYETIYQATKLEMGIKTRLLETLVARIISRIKSLHAGIEHIKVRITKHNPPMGGKVEKVSVELEHEHKSICPVTEKTFLCYRDEHCWCNEVQVFPETMATLQKEFKGCLSREGLERFAKK